MFQQQTSKCKESYPNRDPTVTQFSISVERPLAGRPSLDASSSSSFIQRSSQISKIATQTFGQSSQNPGWSSRTTPPVESVASLQEAQLQAAEPTEANSSPRDCFNSSPTACHLPGFQYANSSRRNNQANISGHG
ncbi:hypothetical protein Nepgr_027743 [Nepenthes gracilis]|uniref:Uncharacterized protein n=1 Tax=Nepenthes gracilis TaxID=150966 RepID=A0AAD3TAD0_NEPGR|nr:hypothetical protein Nepgr_027743 [Nepenthes gracilis]